MLKVPLMRRCPLGTAMWSFAGLSVFETVEPGVVPRMTFDRRSHEIAPRLLADLDHQARI